MHGEPGELNEMDEQSKNKTSTDPSTVSIPPAEGRTDIGKRQGKARKLPADQAANATTSETDQLLSKQPAEGRTDVAESLAEEQEQSYSASKTPTGNPSSKKDAGKKAAEAHQSPGSEG
jgi:hypothetical protein